MAITWIAVFSAMAAAPYAGIDPATIGVLDEPTYTAPERGWAAGFVEGEAGRVRVFVGRESSDAHAWLEEALGGLERDLPPIPLEVDEARGDGQHLVLFRDDNVAARIERPAGGALAVAELLRTHLVEGVPWPEAPEVTVEGDVASVSGEWTRVAWEVPLVVIPETLVPVAASVVPMDRQRARLSGDARRLRVTVWDRYGRGHVVEWESS